MNCRPFEKNKCSGRDKYLGKRKVGLYKSGSRTYLLPEDKLLETVKQHTSQDNVLDFKQKISLAKPG